MSRIATFLFVAALLHGADDFWKKVQDLKSYSELRVYKKGVSDPVNATFADANEERIVVVVKNKEIAIAREDIERIDARPVKTPRKVSTESTTRQTDPDLTPRPNPGIPAPGTSSSSSVSFGGDSRPGFETIYRRPDRPPKN